MVYADADADTDERVVAHQDCLLRSGRFLRSKVGTRRTEGTETTEDFMA